MYCILDDSRKAEPHINWSVGKNDLIENGELLIPISVHKKIENTGLLDISVKHKNWLYTKELFKSNSIENSLNKFITNAMK